MNYITLDIETSGLNPKTDEVIEIGACKVEKNIVTDTFSTFIKPKVALLSYAEQLTGLSEEFFVKAPDEEEAIRNLHEFVCGNTIVAYNARFIENFLSAAYERVGIKFDNSFIDIYTLSKEKLQGKISDFGLKAVCRYYNFLNDRSGCLSEAITVYKVYQKFLQN